MTEADVESALLGAVQKIQALSGRAGPVPSPTTRPIGDLEGFDSLNGVEVGAEATATLGHDVGENPFLDERGRSITVRDAAKRIVAAASKGKKARGAA